MKKIVLKIIMIPFLIVLLVVGHFYYSIYASSYHYQVDSKDSESNESNSIRIGSYNIKSLAYDKDNLSNFNSDISDLNLDVICLQEVDQNSFRSGNIDQVEEMAKANGYNYCHFYSSMWIISGYYGLGILSKYPIVEVSSDLLPNSLLKEPRILTKTTILVGDKNIDIYNTHLTYENNTIREDQMNMVKESIDFNNYSILAGDFNSFGMNNDFVIDGVDSLNKDKTYSTFRTYGSPDDIYYSSKFTKLDEGMKMSSFSDHNILYGEFRIND